MGVEIKVGDNRDVLKTMADQSVHCVVTSPPYFGLRDYGVDGQIGLEETPDAFVAEMVSVFREVRRVLRDDGTLWLNLGDSYSRGRVGRADGGRMADDPDTWKDSNPLEHRDRSVPRTAVEGSSDGAVGSADRPGSRSGGLGEKQLLGIPWRVAFALQADGWYLRQDIIWAKPNPMPESVQDRCTKAHEYVFLLSKSPTYYYDSEAVAEPSIYAPGASAEVERPQGYYDGKWTPERAERGGRNDGSFKAIRETRNKRSVWTVATQPFSEAHFATFPPALIEPCILAGCPEGGTVLDPFGGAGTTGLVSDRLKRNAVLIELNPEYAEMARRRIHADAGMFAEVV